MANVQRSVLVTGATGTVGSEVAARLADEGFHVRALVRRDADAWEKRGVTPVLGDLKDRDAVVAAAQGVDIVVHAAAYIGSDWDEARAVNVLGTESIAQAALAAGASRLVHISTGSVYQWSGEGALNEATPLWESAKDAYAQTKADAERIVQDAAGRGLATTVLRLGMVMSVHPTSVWGPKLIDQMRQGMSWHPEDRINWVHVKNIPDAVMLVLRRSESIGEAYNLVDGDEPARDFFGRVAAWLGLEARAPDRPPRIRRVSADKIRRLGYRPRHTFQEAMKDLERLVRAG